MRTLGLAIAATVSSLFFAVSANAAPNQIPQIPGFPFPGLSQLPQGIPAFPQGLPTLPQLLQPLQNTIAACPTVEIAPGVRIPICVNGLPEPPSGQFVPEAWFPALPIQPWVDLRQRGLDGPVMSQEQAGVCYAFAISDVLDNSLRRQGVARSVAPLHVIATWDDMFSGKRTEPLAAEQTWPYSPAKACELEASSDGTCEAAYRVQHNSWQRDPLVVADRARARSLGFAAPQKATQISKANAIDGITKALSSNRAVYLSIAIDTEMWGFSNVKDGHLRDYGVGDRGSHAVAIVGYRTDGYRREFLLHNSWGETWGDHGYVWITEANLKTHFNSAYLIEAAL